MSYDTDLRLGFIQISAETPDAWLIVFGMDDELNDVEHWMPKSICRLDRSIYEIEVPEWLVIEKELESYEI